MRQSNLQAAEEIADLAPLAGFRNIMVHEYLALDWDHVYRHLETLEDLAHFAGLIRRWLQKSEGF